MLDAHLLPSEDVVRSPVPGPPPCPGAQWDVVRECWECWDAVDGMWPVVAVHQGDHDEPLDEDWIRPPAKIGSAPAPSPVIDLRDRALEGHTPLVELIHAAQS